MDARPAELAAWLASPSFVEAVRAVGVPAAAVAAAAAAADDLSVTGTVTPASSPVGGSHVWRLQVTNTGEGTASGVVLDVQLSPNVVYGFSQATRGDGVCSCRDGPALRPRLLGPSADDSSTAEVVIGTNVTGAGEVSLTATASFAEPDPTPADNTLVLKANRRSGAPRRRARSRA